MVMLKQRLTWPNPPTLTHACTHTTTTNNNITKTTTVTHKIHHWNQKHSIITITELINQALDSCLLPFVHCPWHFGQFCRRSKVTNHRTPRDVNWPPLIAFSHTNTFYFGLFVHTYTNISHLQFKIAQRYSDINVKYIFCTHGKCITLFLLIQSKWLYD